MDLEKAFHSIKGNLHEIPVDICMWKYEENCEVKIKRSCNYSFSQSNQSAVLWREKANNPNTGMGYLIQKVSELKLHEALDIGWLHYFKALRNIVHPRKLNDEKARWGMNPIVSADIKDIIVNLVHSILNTKEVCE